MATWPRSLITIALLASASCTRTERAEVPVCAAPLVACGAACVDTAADARNCGGCGSACATGRVCDGAGRCVQPPLGLAPDLAVAGTVPAQLEPAFTGTALHVVFSRPVLPAALSACLAGGAPTDGGPGTPAGCNLQLVDETSGAAVAPAAIAAAAGGTGSTTEVVLTLASSPARGHAYALTVYGGLAADGASVRPRLADAAGATYLPASFVLRFTGGTRAAIANTTPAPDDADVPASAVPCVEFTAAVDPATLSTASVRLACAGPSGTVELPWRGPVAAGGNVWCFPPTTQANVAGLAGRRTLPPGAACTLRLEAGVRLQGVTAIPTDLPATIPFGTSPGLGLAPVTYASAWVGAAPLAGATSVPRDAELRVTLADPAAAWDPASLATGTAVTLVRGAPPFAAPPPAVDVTAAAAGATFVIRPAAPLDFDSAYTLLLGVGAAGPRAGPAGAEALLETASGLPLAIRFRTAPRTLAFVTPAEVQLSAEAAVPVVFSAPVSPSTVTAGTITALVNGAPQAGALLSTAADLRSATYQATPTWPNNAVTPLAVQVNQGAPLLRDAAGNPVAAAERSWSGTINFTLGGALPSTPPAVSLALPSAGSPGSVVAAPCAGSCAVLGDQAFALAFGGAGLRDRMLPATIGAGTVSLEPTSPSAACVEIPLAVTFVPGCGAGATSCPTSTSPWVATRPFDQAVLVPGDLATPTHRISRGCTYLLRVRGSGMANVLGFGAGPDSSTMVSGATVAPTLAGPTLSALHQPAPALSVGAAPGRVAISASLSAIVAAVASADAIAPESATSVAFAGAVTSGPGSFPAGGLRVAGSVVIFTPAAGAYFRSGSTYRLIFLGGVAGSLRDLAGNALATDLSVDLTPETTPPSLAPTDVAWVAPGTGPLDEPNGAFRLAFSEALREGSLVAPSEVGGVLVPGSVEVRDGAGALVRGLLRLDAADASVLWFAPAGPVGAALVPGVFTVLASPGIEDLAGNALGAPVEATVTVPP